MFKRSTALLIVLGMTLSVLFGCQNGGGAKNGGAGKQGDSANISGTSAFVSGTGSTAEAKTSKGVIRILAGVEPKTLDPGRNNSFGGGNCILQAFEGLTRVDANGATVPGVAESWDITENGTKYTFHLRKAVWSDGQPVTAQDFEYAWKRVLDPSMASEYAYQMYYIQNAEEYSNGKATAEAVGVKALDGQTLQVILRAPAPYFLQLLHFPSYMPVRKDIVEANRDGWAANPASYVTNGAYLMAEWRHNDTLIFKKSPSYWDRDNIALSEIDFVLAETAEPTATELDAFTSGELDAVYERIPSDKVQGSIRDGSLKLFDKLETHYLVINTDKNGLQGSKVRRALSLCIDRKELVETVLMGGEKPAAGLVPYGVSGENASKDFRSEVQAEDELLISDTADGKAARKLLEDAGYPEGKDMPELELVYNTDPVQKKVLEYLQQKWKKSLGINVKLSDMGWKELQSKRQNRSFAIASDVWVGDYSDPGSFLSMWTSSKPGNPAAWVNKDYDGFIEQAQRSGDNRVRMDAFHKAEKTLMTSMPVIPLYYTSSKLLQTPKLKGVQVDPLGFVFLQGAYFDK